MTAHPELKLLNDPEGGSIPEGSGPVIDSHVHIFPEKIFAPLRKWFDTYGWPLRYKMGAEELIQFLLDRGLSRIVVFPFAHGPGMSGYLNSFTADIVKKYRGKVTGLATVFPGEENAGKVLEQGFDLGLAGIKLHAHVQCFDLDEDYMDPVYDACEKHNRPMVIHAGREPKSEAYACDPHEICSADRVKRLLVRRPGLRLVVPHLGVDEFEEFKKMTEEFDNLWLDTAMVITDYLPLKEQPDLNEYRPDRVLYGSDFPNIPYAWDRELKRIVECVRDQGTLKKILYENSMELFALQG